MTTGQGTTASNVRRTVQIVLAIVGASAASIGIIQEVCSHHVALSLAVGFVSWPAALALLLVRHRLLARDGYSGSALDLRLDRLTILLCWLPVAVAIITNDVAHRGEWWLIILIVLVGCTQWRERRIDLAAEVDEAR